MLPNISDLVQWERNAPKWSLLPGSIPAQSNFSIFLLIGNNIFYDDASNIFYNVNSDISHNVSIKIKWL
jgi:hypothetical protein